MDLLLVWPLVQFLVCEVVTKYFPSRVVELWDNTIWFNAEASMLRASKAGAAFAAASVAVDFFDNRLRPMSSPPKFFPYTERSEAEPDQLRDSKGHD